MIIFNFDCFAVVTIDTHDRDSCFDIVPEDEREEEIEVHGFYLTHADATAHIEAMQTRRQAVAERQKNADAQRWFRREREVHLSTVHYIIVPCGHIVTAWFDDIEPYLKKAAKLQLAGIGAPLATSTQL